MKLQFYNYLLINLIVQINLISFYYFQKWSSKGDSIIDLPVQMKKKLNEREKYQRVYIFFNSFNFDLLLNFTYFFFTARPLTELPEFYWDNKREIESGFFSISGNPQLR